VDAVPFVYGAPVVAGSASRFGLDRAAATHGKLPGLTGCRYFMALRVAGGACRKLNPAILVMQSAQDWATKNVPGAIDGARDRRIFLQG
jgi:hypothetical protein